MLDVHPPHESTHTWTDFFIHIATIAVGLLLAIALEQGVEALHHRHQRHQLLEDLHHEALVNKEICEHDAAYFDRELGWLLDVKSYVDTYRASRGTTAAQFPPDYPDAELLKAGTIGDADPQTAVWTTAKESGTVGLLPRDQAATLSIAYGAAELEMQQDKVVLRALDAWTGLMTHDRQQPYRMNLAGESDAELVTLSQAVGEEISAMNSERRYLVLFYGETNAVLDGAMTREQFRMEIMRAFQRFPNRYEVPVATATGGDRSPGGTTHQNP